MSHDLTEQDIEAEITERGLDAPRVLPSDLDRLIVAEHFWHVPGGSTTIVCALTLRSGFVVIGKAACVSPENFSADLGRKIARSDARDKIWELEGYRFMTARQGT